MAGLVPAIHAFDAQILKDVDARHKAGHDGCRVRLLRFARDDEGSLPIQHRWPRQIEMLEQIDERLEPFLAIGVDIHAAIVEKALLAC